MKHSVKKIKFKSGKDANEMLMRKMASNLIAHGRMVTTEAKAKALRPFIERLVTKAKNQTEADKNYLLRYFPDKKRMTVLLEQIGPAFKDRNGGYVRIVRLNQRDSDGTMMSRIEWTQPITVAAPEVKVQTPKTKGKEEEPEAKK